LCDSLFQTDLDQLTTNEAVHDADGLRRELETMLGKGSREQRGILNEQNVSGDVRHGRNPHRVAIERVVLPASA
jgi:hypothetical protein